MRRNRDLGGDRRTVADSLTGRLLLATPALEDPNFDRAVILVLDHDEDGALGLVLNRASEVAVDQALAGWEDLAAEPRVVFGGGPVEPTAVVALGASTDGRPQDGWEPIVGRVRVVDLSDGPILAAGEVDRVRVFAGYAGWAPGQLDSEVAMGAWLTLDAEPGDVFAADPDQLWRDVLRRQPGELALLATFPSDPALN